MSLFIVTVLLMVAVGYTQAEMPHDKMIENEYKDWKKPCNEGYMAKWTPEMEAAKKTCMDKKIKSYACYQFCMTVENGEYKLGGGETDEAERKKDLEEMFDMKNPKSAETMKRWTESAGICVAGWKSMNKKMPTDYNGDCADYKELRHCITSQRKC